MSEKYVRIRLSILSDIADAIRLQKGSENTYRPENFAKIIGAMLVLPSGVAESELTLFDSTITFDSYSLGVLPTVYKGTAVSNLNIGVATFNSNATGILSE